MSEQTGSGQSIGVGVVGYGFMGQTHAKAYQQAERDGYACKLLAVADPGLSSLDSVCDSAGNFEVGESALDHSGMTLHGDAAELFARADIDLVSICTHTDSHVELAIQALEAGKNVLVEKPVATHSEDVARLAQAAQSAPGFCLPAMCLRFWPGWDWIHDAIESRRYGEVRSAVFHRLGSRPDWAQAFYADTARSGGVLHDMHIHDTDFIVHCFGLPDAVTTSGDDLHLSTLYQYADGPVHVLAQAAWDLQPVQGFHMSCTIVCAEATLDYDLGRADQMVVFQGQEQTAVDIGKLSGYDGEIRAVLSLCQGKSQVEAPTMEDAVKVARLLESERLSMQQRKIVSVQG